MVTCQECWRRFVRAVRTAKMAAVTALGVLGPLLVEGAAGPVQIGSARQRRLLCALAADLGRVVDVDLLVELVWADALHATARQQHAEALLATGLVGEAVAAAEALVAAEPLGEGAVAVLVRALVAAGRQSDALAMLARLRAWLADDLGLDPGPQLRELERRVLPPRAGRRTPTRTPALASTGPHRCAPPAAAAAELVRRAR